MEIQINGHSIEFAIEQEKTVKDVVKAISNWAQKRDLIFPEIWINNDHYSVESVPDFLLDNVQKINCIIISKADLVAESIFEASEYCGRLIQFIEGVEKTQSISVDDCKKITEGLEWLLEVTNKVIGLLGISLKTIRCRDKLAQALLEEVSQLLRKIRSNENEIIFLLTQSKSLFSDFRDFLKILFLSDEMRKASITTIDAPDTVMRMLVEVLDEIQNQRQNIEKAASSYHAGKDFEASQLVEAFIDYIYRYLRVCYQLAPVFNIDPQTVSLNEKTLIQKNNEINNLLSQMVQCLENNDIVGLTDILEYEFIPTLDEIEGFCKTVFNLVHSTK